MQQIYRKTSIPKCDFNKVTLQFYWNHTSAWVLGMGMAIFRTPFPNNTSGGLLPKYFPNYGHTCDGPQVLKL